ncbi:MAG: SET domain-containing protein [Candidatus Eisenbacteria bacterium]|nr:SET domain-containing protein [Candidatus Eisenbacteria bacterium]
MAAGLRFIESLPVQSRTPGKVLRCDSEFVGVLVAEGGRRLVAIRPIPRGAYLFTMLGSERPSPTRYSVQVGAELHLDQDCARDEFDLVRRFFWRYLDHHCEPTAFIRDRDVIATRDIATGEGVTFDYNTTEYDMAEPFDCHCDSERCVGTVRGARHLTGEQRARREHLLPGYLR